MTAAIMSPQADIAKEPHPCFFYGSLMDPRILHSITRPGPEANWHSVRASIDGFVRYPYHNEPYPGMIPSSDSSHSVEGILVFGHTLMDRFRLDQFEGDEYTREILTVKVLDPVPASFNVIGSIALAPGALVKAYVYIFSGPKNHLDLSREWDFKTFQRDQVEPWMQTSSDFAQTS